MSAPMQIPSRRSARTPLRPSYSSSSSSSPSSSSSSSSPSSSSYPYPTLSRSSGFHHQSSFQHSSSVSPSASSFAGSPLATKVERAYPEAEGTASRDYGEEEGEYREEKGGRRPSLMGSSLLASTHTVINVGHPSGPPRLISCVRSSQGFDWNQEIFMPSYGGMRMGMDGDWGCERYRGGEGMLIGRREGDTVEIRLEEGEGVLPE
ncbi:MAG: hypothetical protein MMC23_001617 [Stictis urceolatum]|nr:hypothetical protein [Stictis urceolata]